MGVCESSIDKKPSKKKKKNENNLNSQKKKIKRQKSTENKQNKGHEKEEKNMQNNKQVTSTKNQNKNSNNIKNITSNNPNNKEDEDLNKNYIRIIIYDNNTEIFSRPYDKETQFSKIFEDIKNRYLNEEQYYDLIHNKSYYKIENKIIDESKAIINYVKQKEDRRISVNVDIKGLREISNNIDKYIYDHIKYYGKISFSPFQLYIYKKEDNTFQKSLIQEEEINNSQINEVSMNTSYCNGINKLYLFSGGENENLINLFWIIDLKNLKIKKIESKIPSRKHHSLIYIPKKYVFIIGGNNDKTVYYFDTYKQQFFSYPDLDDDYIEPGLIMVNNTYLYVFSNIGKNFLISKTNLRDESKWEKIIPTIQKEINFTIKYFGVCKSNNNSLIFIGENDINENSEKYIFEYNYDKNEIYQSLSKNHSDYDFPEKTFIPFNEESYVLFPNAPKRALKKVSYNKKYKIIHVVDFENDNESQNSQYKITGQYEHKVIFPFDENVNELNNPLSNNNNDNLNKGATLEKNNLNNDEKSSKSIINENQKIIEEVTNFLFGEDNEKKKYEKNSNRKNKTNGINSKGNSNVENLTERNNKFFSPESGDKNFYKK